MHSLKVLILEDNPFQRMALHQMLNANQVFDVLTAGSVEAALCELEQRGPVDIALCDLHMDGEDGLSLIGYLADTGQAGAVIILSSAEASVLDSAAQLARQRGVRILGALQKPASAAAIGALLAQRLSLAGAPETARFEYTEPTALPPLDSAHDYRAQWIPYFQPKVGAGGELVGVELLARWQHPTLGLLAPGRFLPQLEQAGLITVLTWHMLELALSLSHRLLMSRGRALPVAVNIPPQLLDQPDFVPGLQLLLERFAVQPQMLTLEVIEQSARQMAVVQFENLLRLRMAGCRLSIDDFGTGASNIQRLLELPFNELKIPAEFVRGMAEDRRKSAVVGGALFMAKRMALDVVVEGVETAEDYAAVSMLGSPAIQGYFIARPMGEADLMNWLDDLEHRPEHVLAFRSIRPDRAPAGK
ncbi:EAL domain-containing protein [Pseudomonas sp. LP_7_YM]|uniref:EAL domain-containing response regulator n=1 Tax=Pseudomonas sp. LP_7_YM TaxID=2485137 RepID=UPI0010E68679|nr:EAL domain-containing response regulator [Pseudomonas sp. LP_7_YM]TDV62454.1 EAL domain-containing protein (putative c-di-GMP-specific phosphodiesterase class I) [Pseudomonas sp. LP_7_YM]